MGMPSGWELMLVIGVVILLFGGKKIPELAKGMGKGIKDFKKAIKEDEEEVAETTKEIEDKGDKVADAATQTEEKKSENA